MRADRHEHGLQRSATVTGDWGSRQAGEPRLEELMEDPIMGLIWQRDGLEPIRARETLMELRAIVRASRECAC